MRTWTRTKPPKYKAPGFIFPAPPGFIFRGLYFWGFFIWHLNTHCIWQSNTHCIWHLSMESLDPLIWNQIWFEFQSLHSTSCTSWACLLNYHRWHCRNLHPFSNHSNHWSQHQCSRHWRWHRAPGEHCGCSNGRTQISCSHSLLFENLFCCFSINIHSVILFNLHMALEYALHMALEHALHWHSNTHCIVDACLVTMVSIDLRWFFLFLSENVFWMPDTLSVVWDHLMYVSTILWSLLRREALGEMFWLWMLLDWNGSLLDDHSI